ncbi:hypothetical protein BJX96DRAFT_175041 [Aspergillus floccosus]
MDVCYNLVCFAPLVHRSHGAGYFALKPIAISDDEEFLIVAFHWLLKGYAVEQINLCSLPSLGVPDNAKRAGLVRIFGDESCNLIRFGDMIQIITDHPESRPLPKWEILEMHWFIHVPRRGP